MITMLKKELRELWRSKKTIVTFIILAVLAMTSIIMSKFEPQILNALLEARGTELPESFIEYLSTPPGVSQAAANFFGNISNIMIWVIILTTATAVNSEYINGTYSLYLNTKKSEFVITKFAARIIINFGAILLAAAFALLYIAVLFESAVLPGFAQSLIILCVYAAFTTAYSLLFSAVFKTVLKSIGISILFCIVLQMFSSFPVIGGYLPGGFAPHISAFLSGANSTGYIAYLVITVALTALCLVFATIGIKKYRV
ncbi:MAG: ABC transporter permease [Ruminococcus sp.]|nr:ABC transporter permease [Ruminococcus sp.]